MALPVVPSHDAYMVVTVNAIKPDNGKTFEQYIIEYITPCLPGCLQMSHRLDIIFDVYLTSSLKKLDASRGSGTRRRVLGHLKVPKD